MRQAAEAISRQALGALGASRRELVLHSTFRHVLNFRAGARMVALQDDQCAFTPLSIQLKPAFFLQLQGRVQQRYPVVWENESFLCGDLILSCDSSTVVDGRLHPGGALPEPSALLSFIPLLAKPQSLAFCASTALYESLFSAEEAQRLVYDCLAGVALASPRACAPMLCRMLGAGCGLTPGGDDFLVGLLAALYARSDEPRAKGLLGALREALQKAGAQATTEMSWEFLHYAMEGFFSLPILRLMACGNARDALLSATASLVRYGATSGSDTLGGLAYGLSL